MGKGNLGRMIVLAAALVALAGLAAGCKATKVRISKDVKTMVGDETITWDGSASPSAPGGFNQAELKKWLKKSGMEYKKLAIVITRDVRACNLTSASVQVGGSYEYDGFKENFDYDLNETHSVPIPIDTPANIAKRCNKTAAKALAMGIARSLRDADKL